MELLYTKTSPFARKVRILALEKGISLRLTEESPYEKRPILLEKNPAGKIPVLIKENGDPLIDSPVICEYIDSMNDSPILIPRSGEIRFEVLHRAALADAMLEAGLALYVEKKNHPDNVHTGFRMNKNLAVRTSLEYFEKHIIDLDLFRYDSVSLVSAIGSLEFRIPEILDFTGLPRLADWLKIQNTRKSVSETAIPKD